MSDTEEVNPVPGTTEQKSNEDKLRILASLSFIFVIVFLGIPMWWKTTEVYRVSLPYNGIEHLSDIPIIVSSRIGIFAYDEQRGSLLVHELNEAFKNNDLLKINFFQIKLEQKTIQRANTASDLEAIIMQKYNIVSGEFLFIERHNLVEDILMTSRQCALFSKMTSSVKIQRVTSTWIFQEYKLRKILSNIKTIEKKLGKKQKNTNAAPQPQYDVIVSVLNPNPDLQTIEWNVKSTVNAYIQPFLNSINKISNFTLKSQWKYQIPLEFPNKQIKDSSNLGRHYALSEEHLPYIVTSIEKKLGNPISDNPCYHLVIYVPPCITGPLYIYNKNKQRASTNNVDSFLSVKWGGIVIYNIPESICMHQLNAMDQRITVPVDAEHVMQIVLQMLRKLVDLEIDIDIDGVNMEPLTHIEPRQWEIDAMIRTGIIHLISSTTLTLQSLIQLLGGIRNIVINDEVGLAVNNAYENLQLAKEFLRINDMTNATFYAKKAFVSSETAFFHPSMLALLYFPDDQKYAIYIPLFLPIMIPVVLSLRGIGRYFFKHTKDSDKIKSE